MEWVVVVSVLLMVILSLLRVNVILSIIIAAIVAGVMSGLNIVEAVEMLVSGMGGQANTALSYVLLGAFAVAISYTGITNILVKYLIRIMSGKKTTLLLVIAGVASLSQNVVPVHIAFIPILIPPLLTLFDRMQVDRRGVAVALTFGLQAPYILIPAGFGLIFHGIIYDGLVQNGATITMGEVAKSMIIPGLGMIVGLLIAVFITYRKDKEYTSNGQDATLYNEKQSADISFNLKHLLTVFAIVGALIAQIISGSLIIGALIGLGLMFLFFVVPFSKGDKIISDGVGMMGSIAFVMLVASGYGTILKDTGAVDALVEASSGYLGNNKALIAFVLLLVGLLITMGIGSSFGTIPIIAALFVPICLSAGFSPIATAALIGTAGALGDAGSPASDSTLGPTSGLNADGKHNHIWDTCVPTFTHFNIPLFLFGWMAALFL
ncbi:Na+/H+ antiporter family protein [Ornithinibacillus bavariensis]|uniref:Sodium:proton antiporter n=1 Tax=Ornithinibacillus bavariensis TaxID=545502 RepID=A0A919X8C7_9BACI|nr:Na+/H+ antiporter NhaC family protein [Ornithinibacillus bavariensis]GIO27872.1 sodium:proton antiporter [Ornithinibacillus bavariensis]